MRTPASASLYCRPTRLKASGEAIRALSDSASSGLTEVTSTSARSGCPNADWTVRRPRPAASADVTPPPDRIARATATAVAIWLRPEPPDVIECNLLRGCSDKVPPLTGTGTKQTLWMTRRESARRGTGQGNFSQLSSGHHAVSGRSSTILSIRRSGSAAPHSSWSPTVKALR